MPTNKKSIIILTAIVLVLLAVFIVMLSGRLKQDKSMMSIPLEINQQSATTTIPARPMTDEEKSTLGLDRHTDFEVLTWDKEGKIATYRVIGAAAKKPLALEMMTNEEKMAKHLKASTTVQVLERNSAGEITAYKIIKSDADIVTEY